VGSSTDRFFNVGGRFTRTKNSEGLFKRVIHQRAEESVMFSLVRRGCAKSPCLLLSPPKNTTKRGGMGKSVGYCALGSTSQTVALTPRVTNVFVRNAGSTGVGGMSERTTQKQVVLDPCPQCRTGNLQRKRLVPFSGMRIGVVTPIFIPRHTAGNSGRGGECQAAIKIHTTGEPRAGFHIRCRVLANDQT